MNQKNLKQKWFKRSKSNLLSSVVEEIALKLLVENKFNVICYIHSSYAYILLDDGTTVEVKESFRPDRANQKFVESA